MQNESGINISTCISITCIYIINIKLQMGPNILTPFQISPIKNISWTSFMISIQLSKNMVYSFCQISHLLQISWHAKLENQLGLPNFLLMTKPVYTVCKFPLYGFHYYRYTQFQIQCLHPR